MGRDTSLTPYPVATTVILIRRYNTHTKFIKWYRALSHASMHVPFTKDFKWMDWVFSFLNYLRTIPGRDSHPIKYIFRAHNVPNPTMNTGFLDNYVPLAPLIGEAFLYIL